MVCESTHQGNDAMMAQSVFLFVYRSILQETSPGKDHKNGQNVQNFAVKPFAFGSWFHLSFQHFDVLSLVYSGKIVVY